MTFPPLGSLLLSVALASPRLLAADSDPTSPAIPPADEPSAAPAPAPDTANPKPKAPPPFLVPNSSSANGAKPSGSETRPTASSDRRATPPRSIVSGALRESFHYDASLHASAANAKSSDPDALAADGADSDVVIMPKVAVNERPIPRDLEADIARWRSKAPQNHSRFGTGIHEKDFGKVRASVITIFYIPVGGGLSW